MESFWKIFLSILAIFEKLLYDITDNRNKQLWRCFYDFVY